MLHKRDRSLSHLGLLGKHGSNVNIGQFLGVVCAKISVKAGFRAPFGSPIVLVAYNQE